MPAEGPPEEPPTNPVTPPTPLEPPTNLAPPPGGAPYEPSPSYAAPPPYIPPAPGGVPPNQPPRQPGGGRNFLVGIAIGAIPLLLAMIGLGSLFNPSTANGTLGYFLIAGGVGLPVGLIVAIVLSIIARTRPIGLGMLVALVASPVIFFVGCLVVLSRPFG